MDRKLGGGLPHTVGRDDEKILYSQTSTAAFICLRGKAHEMWMSKLVSWLEL